MDPNAYTYIINIYILVLYVHYSLLIAIPVPDLLQAVPLNVYTMILIYVSIVRFYGQNKNNIV